MSERDIVAKRYINSTFIEVLKSMKATSIEAKEMVSTKIGGETLLIRGEAKVGESGAETMLITSEEVTISKELHVQDILGRNLRVNGTISGSELNLSAGLSIQNNSVVLKNGTIESSNGFVSAEGSLRCKDISLTGKIQVEGLIEATGSIISNESITSKRLSVSESIDAPSIAGNISEFNFTRMDMMRVSHKCSVDGEFEANGNVTLNGEMVTITAPTVRMKEMEVENRIKSQSVFSTRLYTEDLAASGFITARTITAKELFIAKGQVVIEGKAIMRNDLNVDNVKVSNSLSSTTMKATSLTVGGIEARKVQVDGDDMTVGGINVKEKLDKINELEKRIMELEALVSKIHNTK